MKISSRELILGWCTALALLLAFSYWLIRPRLAEWRETLEYQEALRQQIVLAQRIVDQRPEWNERMDNLRSQLTRYPSDRDVTADYLRILERLAAKSKLTLLKRNARKEQPFGDLLELSIDCTWEGDLEALVRFIYAMEREETIMDMEELTVSLISGKENRLKGSFAVTCIYGRQAADEKPETEPATQKNNQTN